MTAKELLSWSEALEEGPIRFQDYLEGRPHAGRHGANGSAPVRLEPDQRGGLMYELTVRGGVYVIKRGDVEVFILQPRDRDVAQSILDKLNNRNV